MYVSMFSLEQDEAELNIYGFILPEFCGARHLYFAVRRRTDDRTGVNC